MAWSSRYRTTESFLMRFDFDLILDPEMLLAGSISLDELDDAWFTKDSSF